jgi:transposase
LEFLERVAEWVGQTDHRVVIVWGGAPWHRANVLKEKAKELGLELVQLPGYSPDLNPIEGLWNWMRGEVTQHHCYKSVRVLVDACKEFIELINKNIEEIVNRLWPKFERDPQVE